MTQTQLAERVAVTSTYVSALEHNRKEPSFGLVTSMSRAFGVPQEILYWDAITFPTTMKTHKKEIRLAKSLVRAVYQQLSP